jgi:DNA-binding IclR family transcriptional regulator
MKIEGKAGAPPYHVTSVDHALQLLLLLKGKPQIRVSEAAAELGVARSTAHRLLGVLVYRGFAVQDPASRAYRPGPVLVEVGMGALARLDVRQRARPFLERIAALTGETTSLLILEGAESRFVDSVESARTVRVGSRAGVNLPAHLTSGGKAMLAMLPKRALVLLYPDDELDGMTPSSTTSRAQLMVELDTIRGQGYAVNHGGTSTGLVAVGVAVCDQDRTPVAAVSVAAPASRTGPEEVEQLRRVVQLAVRELEETLYD